MEPQPVQVHVGQDVDVVVTINGEERRIPGTVFAQTSNGWLVQLTEPLPPPPGAQSGAQSGKTEDN
jgi:hypothetical protein